MIKAVVNPAGAGGKTIRTWETVKTILKEKGAECEIFFSSPTRSITEIVSDITSKGEEVTLLVLGGDGTMNLAVNGIQDFEKTKAAFLSCGSGNDLAKALNLPKDPETCIEQVLAGNIVRTLDVGELTLHSLYDDQGNPVKDFSPLRRFNISSGIGFDAEICAYVERSEIKKVLNAVHMGKLSYIAEALKVIFTYQNVKAEMVIDGNPEVYEELLFTAGMNTAYEGGGFRFAPDAVSDDGMLDFCVGNQLSRFDFFRIFPYAYSGAHVKFKGVSIRRGVKAEIKAEAPMWVHTDGEVIGRSDHITLSISDQKMKMVI